MHNVNTFARISHPNPPKKQSNSTWKSSIQKTINFNVKIIHSNRNIFELTSSKHRLHLHILGLNIVDLGCLRSLFHHAISKVGFLWVGHYAMPRSNWIFCFLISSSPKTSTYTTRAVSVKRRPTKPPKPNWLVSPAFARCCHCSWCRSSSSGGGKEHLKGSPKDL